MVPAAQEWDAEGVRRTAGVDPCFGQRTYHLPPRAVGSAKWTLLPPPFTGKETEVLESKSDCIPGPFWSFPQSLHGGWPVVDPVAVTSQARGALASSPWRCSVFQDGGPALLWGRRVPPEPQPLCVCVLSCSLVVPNSLQPLDFATPGSSVHGILQARILEWVAIPFARGSS